ncbi:hypothetical protein FRC10_002883 [Ceratobasidium sp. 414]|nr:hypothetical protein FRC10_002883 [Ceratobasidium sp. 414]
MVSPWVTYGSLLSYIRAYPTVNRYELCVQIAEGLAYMHEKGVDNVVVSDAGIAKLTDFGCATMKRDFPVYFTVTDSLNYSVRWAAPELFLEDGLSSFETDVYALAMEAITGEVPHKDRADRVVIHAVIVKRALPTRPVEQLPISDTQANELWDMLERCWSYEPGDRPDISQLRDFFTTVANGGSTGPVSSV